MLSLVFVPTASDGPDCPCDDAESHFFTGSPCTTVSGFLHFHGNGWCDDDGTNCVQVTVDQCSWLFDFSVQPFPCEGSCVYTYNTIDCQIDKAGNPVGACAFGPPVTISLPFTWNFVPFWRDCGREFEFAIIEFCGGNGVPIAGWEFKCKDCI